MNVKNYLDANKMPMYATPRVEATVTPASSKMISGFAQGVSMMSAGNRAVNDLVLYIQEWTRYPGMDHVTPAGGHVAL